jgi:putative transposase
MGMFKKGQLQSNNYQKARKRAARKHLRVSRQRRGVVEREALRVMKSLDFIACVDALAASRRVDLNIKRLKQNSKQAKSIHDVAWYTVRQWLEYFGFKYGKMTVAVPPQNTSQNCSNCGRKVAKSLSPRTHICPHCGDVEDRDFKATINILKKRLSTRGHAGIHPLGERFPILGLETSCQVKETL